jgi:HSP20 family protein
MSLIPWNNAFDPFVDSDALMPRQGGLTPYRGMQNAFVPALDVYEDKENVIVETPLAGIDLNNVKVSVEKGMLTIAGSTQKEHEIEEKNYYRKEVRSGTFYRQVPLPVSVIEDKVAAEFENGILKITCPKAEQDVQKKIDVKIIKKDKK